MGALGSVWRRGEAWGGFYRRGWHRVDAVARWTRPMAARMLTFGRRKLLTFARLSAARRRAGEREGADERVLLGRYN
jgi:hypothetical protein